MTRQLEDLQFSGRDRTGWYGSCSTKYVRAVRLMRLVFCALAFLANCDSSFILRLEVSGEDEV